jgi:4-diphosphocytidyl-2-C-methyl-D-erythritol kinase
MQIKVKPSARMHVSAAPTATCDAPAKINLCLRIVGRRADGYHLLDSIFAALTLADRVAIRVENVSAAHASRVAVRCEFPGVPNDRTNLAARAAEAVLAECGVGAEVTITIDKLIPPGSGLGGGSSNAAAVLRTLPALLGRSIEPARAHALALALGADVPFFLTGGCARVRGIGERVDPISGWPGQGVVVALPPIAVSTAWAFRQYAAGFATEPAEPTRLAAGAALEPSLLRNDLETVVLAAHPVLGHLKRALQDAGTLGAVMSGSGSAVLGLVPAALDPEALAAELRTRHPGTNFHGTRIAGRPVRYNS